MRLLEDVDVEGVKLRQDKTLEHTQELFNRKSSVITTTRSVVRSVKQQQDGCHCLAVWTWSASEVEVPIIRMEIQDNLHVTKPETENVCNGESWTMVAWIYYPFVGK